MKELHSDEYYSTCWACGRVIYDLGLRAYVCRLTNKTIGGNFEAFKPTDCPEWKNT